MQTKVYKGLVSDFILVLRYPLMSAWIIWNWWYNPSVIVLPHFCPFPAHCYQSCVCPAQCWWFYHCLSAEWPHHCWVTEEPGHRAACSLQHRPLERLENINNTLKVLFKELSCSLYFLSLYFVALWRYTTYTIHAKSYSENSLTLKIFLQTFVYSWKIF